MLYFILFFLPFMVNKDYHSLFALPICNYYIECVITRIRNRHVSIY